MILIVDDKPENIFSLKSTLELHGFEVDAALSGEDALKKILKNKYALIILDVQMPAMDGFEVAEAISGYNKSKDIPIIFLSAVSTHKKFILKGYTSGAIDYVTKPVDPDILLLKVKTFYRLYEQTQQLQKAQAALQKEVDVRKKAQLDLQYSIQELHIILDSLPQIAFTATPAGTIDFVNFCWYEYAPSKDAFPQTAPGEESIQEVWRKATRSGEPLQLEVKIRHQQNGDYQYHLLKALPITTEAGIIKWIGTLTNINEQKRSNELLEEKVAQRTMALSAANKELEVSNHDLQQFASVASHDLKEPLRKIQVFSSMIRDNNFVEAAGLSFFNKIILSSERMSRLIDDLLNFSKLSAADAFQRMDLNDIVQEILSDLELSIAEKGAVINVNGLPEADVTPGLMRQAFQNLISNALKFSKPGVPPVITIESQIVAGLDFQAPAREGGGYCRITVTDNGIGFDEKYRDRIFTLFQRLHPRDNYEGTGIGLAIVKKIVEKHNGMVTASSQPGNGTSFLMVLPLHQTGNTL